jgi:mRNA-degrading endonuclease RelE of RelBE toxin-antitoxin system
MRYEIRFKPRALKDGKKIPKHELVRIFEKLMRCKIILPVM